MSGGVLLPRGLGLKGVYDGPIRTGLRCNHGVFDVLGHADVKEHWEKVIQPEAEKKEDGKGSGDGGAEDDDEGG